MYGWAIAEFFDDIIKNFFDFIELMRIEVMICEFECGYLIIHIRQSKERECCRRLCEMIFLYKPLRPEMGERFGFVARQYPQKVAACLNGDLRIQNERWRRKNQECPRIRRA